MILEEKLLESFQKKITIESKIGNDSVVYFMEWFLDDQTKEWFIN